MNNPIRAINKATPKGLRLDGLPGGDIVKDPGIDFAELHRLRDDAMQFALAKYNRDKDALVRSLRLLKPLSERLAVKLGWKYRKRETLHKAAELALLQHIEPVRMGNVCHGCNGLAGVAVCKLCDGTGFRPRPDVFYASFLGVSDNTYTETWERRVAALYTLCGGWDAMLWREWKRVRVEHSGT